MNRRLERLLTRLGVLRPLKPGERICPRCDGKGYLYAEAGLGGAVTRAPTIPCPECGTSGRVRE
jgi:DnaJ-class molecular chaperone